MEPEASMRVEVQFYSYFKDLTGCTGVVEELPADSSIADLLNGLYVRFPKLAAMAKSTLIAVGVEYQPRQHRLKDGDVVSLFPPVQGG
jgi:molybdopterin converting factor small subunit